MSKLNYKRIGHIGNFYGGLNILQHDGKYYWAIEDYNNNMHDIDSYHEIPKRLYDALVAYHKMLDGEGGSDS